MGRNQEDVLILGLLIMVIVSFYLLMLPSDVDLDELATSTFLMKRDLYVDNSFSSYLTNSGRAEGNVTTSTVLK